MVAVEPPAGPPGLLIANPPYGERLGDRDELSALYAELGDRLKARFAGWRAAVFTGNPEYGKRMGLRAVKTNVFHNGPLECRLFAIPDRAGILRGPGRRRPARPRRRAGSGHRQRAEGFVNRLRKNLRHLGRWAEREGITCYRLYDADLPEYAVVLDRYEQWLHVQEYARHRAWIPPAPASGWSG